MNKVLLEPDIDNAECLYNGTNFVFLECEWCLRLISRKSTDKLMPTSIS